MKLPLCGMGGVFVLGRCEVFYTKHQAKKAKQLIGGCTECAITQNNAI